MRTRTRRAKERGERCVKVSEQKLEDCTEHLPRPGEGSRRSPDAEQLSFVLRRNHPKRR